MDSDLLRQGLFPLLRRSVNYYLHLLEPGPDEKLHLPRHELRPGAVALGVPDAPGERSTAENRRSSRTPLGDVLNRLTDYPAGKDGFWIGHDLPLTQGHRHFSQLLMIYPLHLYQPDTPGHRQTIETSMRHWIGMPGGLQGYSFVNS